MNYVIIGNSAAAISAVEGIRQIDKQGSITILSDEPYHTYSRPLISYFLAGKVSEGQMYYRPQDFYKQFNIKTLFDIKAHTIDTLGKVVKTEQGDVAYDKLLIATGGKPVLPPIQGIAKEGVSTFIKLDDVKEVKEVAVSGKRAVIIGAGLIGLKAAEALVQLGLKTTVIELSNKVLGSILDSRASEMVKNYLETQGIEFKLNSVVTGIGGEKTVSKVLLKDDTELDADLVIVAAGVVPNIEVVKNTDIKCNLGIVVDDNMQTNIPDIYAAGDVAEGYDILYDKNKVLPILPNAYFQGEIAGKVMAGGDMSFDGGFAMNSIGFFGLPVITAGIVDPEGDGYEIMVEEDDEEKIYRKIVLRDNVVEGFVLLNHIDRSGILTGLIREKACVEEYKKDLMREDFGFINFPAEIRKNKLLGGMA